MLVRVTEFLFIVFIYFFIFYLLFFVCIFILMFLFKTFYFIVYIIQQDNESETMRMENINKE